MFDQIVEALDLIRRVLSVARARDVEAAQRFIATV